MRLIYMYTSIFVWLEKNLNAREICTNLLTCEYQRHGSNKLVHGMKTVKGNESM